MENYTENAGKTCPLMGQNDCLQNRCAWYVSGRRAPTYPGLDVPGEARPLPSFCAVHLLATTLEKMYRDT